MDRLALDATKSQLENMPLLSALQSLGRALLRRAGYVALLLAGMVLSSCLEIHAQEYPYFVTYSQEMEEPGNLDIESFSVVGNPPGGNSFIGSDIEFEYGLKGWWTTEFYLDGQATQNESTIFTGFRWENRFRQRNQIGRAHV